MLSSEIGLGIHRVSDLLKPDRIGLSSIRTELVRPSFWADRYKIGAQPGRARGRRARPMSSKYRSSHRSASGSDQPKPITDIDKYLDWYKVEQSKAYTWIKEPSFISAEISIIMHSLLQYQLLQSKTHNPHQIRLLLVN